MAATKRRGVEWLPLAGLEFDPVVNRELREEWVAKIATNFNPEAVGVLLVSIREGGRSVVIDGQHRAKAMLSAAVGYGDQLVECEVYEGLTVEEEAALFVLRNERRNLSHIDTFLKRIVSGDVVAVKINEVVKSCGLVIHKQAGEGHITASKALERIYLGDRLVGQKENPKALGDALGVLVATFGRGSSSIEGQVIHGLGLVFLREDGRVDKKTMAEKLAKVPNGVAGIIGKARGAKEMHSKTMPHAMAGVIVDIYNQGRRDKKTKLQSWWE